MASNLCGGHLPVGLSLGRWSLLLVGPLFHFPQYHSEVHDMTNVKVLSSIFMPNHLQAGH